MGIFCDFLYSVFLLSAVLGLSLLGLAVRRGANLLDGDALALEHVLHPALLDLL